MKSHAVSGLRFLLRDVLQRVKAEERPGIRKKRIGWILLGLSILCCGLGLLNAKRPVRTAYQASGREESHATPPPPAGSVSVNTADAEELMMLPGVGEYLAQQILEERERNGVFHYPEDLMAVKGIGEAKLRKIRPLLNLSVE